MTSPTPVRCRGAAPIAVAALVMASVACIGVVSAPAATDLPGFKEAIEVISGNLVGFDGIDMQAASDAALRGLLSVVDPGAEIVDDGEVAPGDGEETPANGRDTVPRRIEGSFLYVPLPSIASGSPLPADAASPAAAAAIPFSPPSGEDEADDDVPPAGDDATALETPGDASAIDGVLLDLRGSHGEDLAAAVGLVAAFVNPGTLAFVAERRGEDGPREYRVDDTAGAWAGIPLVILIDGSTGPAAEVAAGALRDLRRAVLIGSPTPGQAVQREAFPLPDGRSLLLATLRVRFPSGAVLFPAGAQPDVTIEPGEAALEPAEASAPGAETEGLESGYTADGPGLRTPGDPDEDETEPPEPDIDASPDESGDADGAAAGEGAAGEGADGEGASGGGASGGETDELLLDPAVRVSVDVLKGFRALRPLMR